MDREQEMSLQKRFDQKPKISEFFGGHAEKVYKILDISSDDDCDVRIIDQVGALVMFHYIRFSKTVYHIRGIIYNILEENIVCQSFCFTPELTIEEYQALNNVEEERPYVEDFVVDSDSLIMQAEEGSVLRLFFSGNNWIFSTHQKIHGENSKWAGPAFVDLFYEMWGEEEFDNVFHRHLCYVFIIHHPSTKMMCEVQQPKISLSRVYDTSEKKSSLGLCYFKGGIDDPHTFLKKKYENISFPDYQKVETKDNFVELASALNWKYFTGILVHNPRGSYPMCFKILPPLYKKHKIVRGNNPNIALRYLELYKDNGLKPSEEDEDSLTILKSLSNENDLKEFDKIETNIQNLLTFFENVYYTRYIRKIYWNLPKIAHEFIKRVHVHFYPNVDIKTNIRTYLCQVSIYNLKKLLEFHKKTSNFY